MTAARTQPPITYFGGKTRLAQRIAALLPQHREAHYVEPFAGSLAVLFSKARRDLKQSPMLTAI